MPTPYQKNSNYTILHTATADVNATVLIARPCRFNGVNHTAVAGRWIKLYDLADAPTVSDVPFMSVLTFNGSVGTMLPPSGGIWCQNGLAIRITAAAALDDNTAVSAGDVSMRSYYRLD